ncbi:23S rRNA m(5)U-1939 methyltransferase [Devosia lucknowensis]|uniref:23S rRNA m(5)U-1939 methyltransferase n=1 Tax=Devosia lucknowensis TaxID=1096929 RepID=A0A1Y6GBN3_9HYPH|nr:class I SAM-dependent RNA methyltransferase [Devosia lucknowensis]SMQ85877.1 23S rRNA m(5)U-1939 methyltransferase [Devosia lucknowensis]
MTITATIESLGQKGEGIVTLEGRKVFVPFALPGETGTLDVDGERGRMTSLSTVSPHRAEPFCPYFGSCGGCQLQHMDAASYAQFKTGLVETPLRQLGIDAKVERFVLAHGAGRRRATLHARKDAAGYMRIRSHDLLDIATCPILVPALKRTPDIARALGAAIGECDVSFTATNTGIDVAIRNAPKGLRAEKLVPLANTLGLARLAVDREMILLRQQPSVTMGNSEVDLPIGSFLQATAEAETVLADYVLEAVGRPKSVADLFCGIGPFALRLAQVAPVYAADSDRAGIVALDKAVRHTRGLKTVTAKTRDLFRDPLTRFELTFETLVLDPPRAGAQAQIKEIALSKCRHVVMVACDPKTFARDAEHLVQAGFRLEKLIAVDQFAWSNHIEVAATFRR